MGLTIELPDGSVFNGDHPVADVGDGGGSDAAVVRNAGAELAPTRGQAQALEMVGRVRGASRPAGGVIAGYAGTGKTTMLRLIADAFGVPAVLTPTGKAALRVSEASGLPAQTIHRWLYSPREDPKTGKVVFVQKQRDLEVPSNRLVVVDEASMLGPSLWADLWRAADRYNLRVILVGDAFQLPPVTDDRNGPEFSTMTPAFAAKHGFERVELTEVLRQAAGSPVIQASMRLRAGEGVSALAGLPRVQPAQLGDCATAAYTAGGVVITHTNAARFRVNYGMRNTLIGVDAGARGPQSGEPLLCLRNNYDLEVYNGEQLTFGGWESGQIRDAIEVYDRYSGAEGWINYGAALVNGKRCILAAQELAGDVGKLGGLALSIGARRFAEQNSLYAESGDGWLPYLQANFGYCYTAHKAQGSQWPYVVVVCEPSVKLNEEAGKRWIYTALTRAETMAAVYFGRV